MLVAVCLLAWLCWSALGTSEETDGEGWHPRNHYLRTVNHKKMLSGLPPIADLSGPGALHKAALNSAVGDSSGCSGLSCSHGPCLRCTCSHGACLLSRSPQDWPVVPTLTCTHAKSSCRQLLPRCCCCSCLATGLEAQLGTGPRPNRPRPFLLWQCLERGHTSLPRQVGWRLPVLQCRE